MPLMIITEVQLPLQVVFFHHPERTKQLTRGGLPEAKLRIRIVNYPESMMQIRSMKASAIGRLVTVCGTVVRIGVVRPRVTQMDFTCNKCSTSSTCRFEDGRYMPPTACPGEGCRSKSFSPLKSTAHTIDWQKIRVQVNHVPPCIMFCMQQKSELPDVQQSLKRASIGTSSCLHRSFKVPTETAAAKFPGLLRWS